MNVSNQGQLALGWLDNNIELECSYFLLNNHDQKIEKLLGSMAIFIPRKVAHAHFKSMALLVVITKCSECS